MAKIPRVALLLESSRAAGRALLKGVADFSHHHGRWSFYWEPTGLEKVLPRLKLLDLDGIILRDVMSLDSVRALGIPAVVVGHQFSEVSGMVNVVTDSETIGRLGAQHLLGCGFKHFAYCGILTSPREQTTWSKGREESFRKCLQGEGADCQSYAVAPDEDSWLQARRALSRWLRSLPRPCGLMACNDDIGKEVIEACKLARLTVPDDVAVIGVDNDELVCGLSDPSLSSVAVNFQKAGYEAARVLGRLMAGSRKRPARILAEASYVVSRRSTDILAIEDAAVAKACRYIRDHSRENVLVSAAVRGCGLSRRALEKRFRALTKHSVLDEIRRVRTGEIARLLLETNLSVAEVGAQLGFDGPEHVARYFRAIKGQTPLDYRKTHGYRGK